MPLIPILVAIGLVFLIPTAYAGYIGAPYAPTRKPAIKKAFDLLEVGEDAVVVDLGAGDGKVLLAAHQRGARAIGYELSPIMWLVTWIRVLGKKSISILMLNFYKQQLPEETTHIFMFLMPEHMEKIHAYLTKQKLPNLQFVLSYSFPFPDVPPLHVVQTERAGRVFIYPVTEFTGQQEDA